MSMQDFVLKSINIIFCVIFKKTYLIITAKTVLLSPIEKFYFSSYQNLYALHYSVHKHNLNVKRKISENFYPS